MLPSHPLAIISVSTTENGSQVLANSIEGTTSLYDAATGEVIGRCESYLKESGKMSEPGEFCKAIHNKRL